MDPAREEEKAPATKCLSEDHTGNLSGKGQVCEQSVSVTCLYEKQEGGTLRGGISVAYRRTVLLLLFILTYPKDMQRNASARDREEESPSAPLRDPCPDGSTGAPFVFYEVGNVPVHSVLLMRTREQAVNTPTGDIALALCPGSGFITNVAFEPGLMTYSEEYEGTQGFSPTFNVFHKRLALDLINRYNLRGKNIIEIGCGKGEFLALLCTLGDNNGVGFDPVYVSGRLPRSMEDSLTFIEDFYSEKYADYKGDFVCCKMTLEHIHNPADFVGMVRRSIGERTDTMVFFQVPEALRIFRELAFWDIYYEHCSYFSRGSLARLFRSQGFDVLNLWTDYDDQYLMIEARPVLGTPAPPLLQERNLDETHRAVAYFAENIQDRLDAWQRVLKTMHRNGRRVVLWGGGSKAEAFLTTLDVQDEVGYIVDINPYKHNTFSAKTGHKIVPPDFLRTYKPDSVVIMNPIYHREIQQDLEQMGVSPEIIPINADPTAIASKPQ